MEPYFFNCLLLYVLVVLASLIQSGFSVIKKHPLLFILFVLFVPIVASAIMGSTPTWDVFSAANIFVYTLVLTYVNTKSVIPKINEAYILIYTLFHWYLLFDSIDFNHPNAVVGIVGVISVAPTCIVLRNVFVSERLSRLDKIISVYWFIFIIAFTYIDQVALHVIAPVLTFDKIDIASFIAIAISAAQLYFISIFLSLIVVAIPLFHLGAGLTSFKVRWKDAMESWRTTLSYKLDNYVEYQVPKWIAVMIIVVSGVMFYLDHTYQLRSWLIVMYTLFFPIIFFCLKYSPAENLPGLNTMTKSKRDKLIDDESDL